MADISISPEMFLLLFGVLVIASTTLIFRVSKASWPGLAASIFISAVLTALAFYRYSPGAGLTVLFYLAIGFGAIILMHFSRTWPGFAASVVIASLVLALYFYSLYPAYGFAIAVGYILAVIILAWFMLKAFAIKHQSQQPPPMTQPRLGGTFSPPRILLPAGRQQNDPDAEVIEAFVVELETACPDPNAQAEYLITVPDYRRVVPFLSRETRQAISSLESGSNH